METLLTTSPKPIAPAPGENSFLETAADIGRLICRDAIWHRSRCNFLTSINDPAYDYPRPYFKALEADFYSGSAGVAFFLAALYRAAPDRQLRKTALGILQTTLDNARRIAPPSVLGFFTGWTGIAWVAIQAGRWLGEEEPIVRGLQLLHSVATLDLEQTGMDVVDGAAGVIPVLRQVEAGYPEQNRRDFVIRLADHLLSTAERSPAGWSWKTVTGGNHRNLTGFAHGVAGIVNALLEAADLTGSAVYREAAFEGLRYENTWFLPAEQNWPDFRMGTQAPSNPMAVEAPACSCAWCHGAPGIALSRLRGFELTGDKTLLTEAETAVRTTARQLTWEQQMNFSQCHGLAGNADVLLEASAILQEPAWREKAEATGRMGQERFARTGLWANGLYNDFQIPDFMLGLSGTGYFYLRLFRPESFRSVLLLR
ncbi:lanthionine synthetase LanC family protein [Larkinella soli]|uniref:lanthionine synthetase LanC family protein n=1 Tax=Larkinella soli TaxID=1770527 RepID=UPI0013E2B514|nr:lanthionine synthetase LanC family protein [Larkinella soli]